MHIAKTVTQFVLVVAIFTFASGCASQQSIPSGSRIDRVAAGSGVDGRLIAKTATVDIEVEDIQSLDEKIRSVVKNNGGYLISSRLNSSHRYNAKIKVPAKELESTMNLLAGLGKERSRTIEMSDVTEDVVDSEAELTNLVSLRGRARELLAKATTVDEILKVETELNRIQTRIDTINGRLKALHNQVDMSLLSVSASEHRVYGPLGYLGIGLWWVVEKLFVIK
ncbi:MAG: DUF4349 domain-containing protein [Gammaproteobacteria bacterium]|nr:DUF4349 domain-containing protein [Gammaproteobacteria bacterium]